MSVENVGKFEELLRSDEGLQAKLREATEAYQGDRADGRVARGSRCAYKNPHVGKAGFAECERECSHLTIRSSETAGRNTGGLKVHSITYQ